ncbi:HAMP domain-containing histidine kinase [Nocardioides donggukensis]|uniref:histidine kinase n=1 Tax=Nocardioides donggukensis TaxID=2774019 RepID=A0A927Q0S2_9ACTN|nr:HAMP domain-containing histidine kinase [Nocardioides donggukensis]MBD8868754.1 HAMP domain-containing histidine kinase [Nocardioides donggukensis]
MRERLTAAFVLIAVLVLTVVGIARLVASEDLVRAQAADALGREARMAAVVLVERDAAGQPVDEATLADLVAPDSMLEYRRGDRVLRASGADYDAAAEHEEGAAEVGEVRVVVRGASADLAAALAGNRTSLLVLLLALVLVAALVGFAAARWISAPFRSLAEASRGLSRGRFDLDLPRSSLPEVASIEKALRLGAGQVEQWMVRDRALLRHASHMLRTPVTALRLELEDALQPGGEPVDAREVLERCVAELVRLDAMLGELLSGTLDRNPMAWSEVSVREVAEAVGERWRSDLGESVELRVHVDNGAAERLMPGPLEQVLDALLGAVRVSRSESVGLRFAGQDRYVRVGVTSAAPETEPLDEAVQEALQRARVLAEALGGRVTGALGVDGAGLMVLLPRH